MAYVSIKDSLWNFYLAANLCIHYKVLTLECTTRYQRMFCGVAWIPLYSNLNNTQRIRCGLFKEWSLFWCGSCRFNVHERAGKSIKRASVNRKFACSLVLVRFLLQKILSECKYMYIEMNRLKTRSWLHMLP